MKKYFSFLLVCLALSAIAFGQKKVAAVVNLFDTSSDTISIDKGKSFVVQLPVRNRAGDDWKLAKPVEKCNFTQSMLGQAGMMPNQQEPKLMFFKATEKGSETIQFIYKNPRAKEGELPEEKTLVVNIE